MWQANKTGILILLSGLLLLGGVWFYLLDIDTLLAEQVLSAGICVLLFVVAFGSWWSVRRDLRRHREDSSGEAQDTDE